MYRKINILNKLERTVKVDCLSGTKFMWIKNGVVSIMPPSVKVVGKWCNSQPTSVKVECVKVEKDLVFMKG